ncbi:type II secretion system protein E [Acrasis kona]|uniref:Type II secretion system protein E n=1 Tax=Acrasis kona TaxID=1008807 RepID=A0AAW2Z1T8_9EUKA
MEAKDVDKNKRYKNRVQTILNHLSPNVNRVRTGIAATMGTPATGKDIPHQLPLKTSNESKTPNSAHPKNNKWLIGFPKTTAKATLFSRVMEKVYDRTVDIEPTTELVEQPKGDPPNTTEVFRNMSSSSSGTGLGGGHVCIVGPTGSGKSTIVRGILCALTAQNTLAIYSMEYPVEVNLNTHGLFHVCQIDMFQEIQGKQRSLATTANALLRHDPDMIYFGELRHKIDFETATSIALSGVAVISTGHASSPIDLLERLRSMNIDLKTQFRAFKCIMGVKRVPILCPHCKKQMVMYGKSQNRAMQLFNLYRIVSSSKSERRQVTPIVCMPPDKKNDGESKSCPHCVNGYIRNHTIYEYLYITPESDMDKLRQTHTYTTEETLISLIQEGSVNPLYLQNSL